MTTLANLVDEVLLNLEGFGALQDTIASATLGSTNLGTGFTEVVLTSPQLTDAAGVTPTLLEVKDELMYVGSATFGAGTLTCSVLRGYRGTAPVSFGSPEYAKVNPRYPRAAVKRAINDTMLGLYPRLPAIKTTNFTYLSNTHRYDMPSDARNVLSVRIQDYSNPPQWHRAKRWAFDNAWTSTDVNGKSIEVFDGNPSKKVRVVYSAEPSIFNNESETLSTTGLLPWTREIIVLGACWRLTSFMDAVSATGSHASQMLMNEGQRDAVGRQSVARYFLGMFETRLAEAEARLQDEYPAPRHYLR